MHRAIRVRPSAQHATVLSHTTSDPALRFPAAIQLARVEMGASEKTPDHLRIQSAQSALSSTIGSAKKLGYYELECEARLALGEVEIEREPVQGRSLLSALAAEARSHGLELIAQKAERAARASAAVVASNAPIN